MDTLISRILVNAPVERCFNVTRSIDAHEATSTLIRGKAVRGKTTGLSDLGDETTWSARFFLFRFRVRTRIHEIVHPTLIREVRVQGIPRCFNHTYTFTSSDEGTYIEDSFQIALPFGRIGALFFQVFLTGYMKKVQDHRLEGIKMICEGDEWKDFLPA